MICALGHSLALFGRVVTRSTTSGRIRDQDAFIGLDFDVWCAGSLRPRHNWPIPGFERTGDVSGSLHYLVRPPDGRVDVEPHRGPPAAHGPDRFGTNPAQFVEDLEGVVDASGA
jgi:hypothetical protein